MLISWLPGLKSTGNPSQSSNIKGGCQERCTYDEITWAFLSETLVGLFSCYFACTVCDANSWVQGQISAQALGFMCTCLIKCVCVCVSGPLSLNESPPDSGFECFSSHFGGHRAWWRGGSTLSTSFRLTGYSECVCVSARMSVHVHHRLLFGC